ncbi:MAG: phenylalanine--tRNA ligase subunit alpha [Calditrichaeota bacterium]|nr:MAG: phenylalanine--tRNA ligase subunit alpha [Calditrichota bacterium]
MDVKKLAEEIKSSFQEELKNFENGNLNFEDLKNKFLGRKGLVADAFSQMRNFTDKALAGQILNSLKNELTEKVNSLTENTSSAKTKKLDLSLPGRKPNAGTLHVVTETQRQIEDIFFAMGFEMATGPQVETDFFNFESLNFPPDHPAREMHDTFFVEGDVLLRTHTSNVQIHAMKSQEPPVRVIAPGKCYRNDTPDATHSPVFQQIEALYVDKNVTFTELKGTLDAFVKALFGKATKTRFRPSFFPFTEPSAEVDVTCVVCKGKGCNVCKQTGWIEILGAGMVDPNVLEAVGYDSEIYSGYAFGLGIERVAMLKYGIPDLRLFFQNDIRFLKQF